MDQTRMLATLRRHGLAVTAYCPLALGRVTTDARIRRIADVHGKTAAQVALRWLVQRPDVIAIPKASSVERLTENLAIFDFTLDTDEMLELSRLAYPGSRLINEPQWVPAWD